MRWTALFKSKELPDKILMSSYNRRTFLKQAAMLTAATASSSIVLPSVLGSPGIINRQTSNDSFFTRTGKPDVIAHRGGDGQWPGETLLAMRRARELGVDMLEMDIFLTSDNRLVLMHDNDVSSTTEFGKKAQVHDLELAQLQRLNAAYRWPDDSKTHPYNLRFDELPKELQKALRVPTLEEVFDEFSEMRMNIEMKWWPEWKNKIPSPAPTLSKLLNNPPYNKIRDRVLVASFSHSFLTEFRSLSKGVATSASTQEVYDYMVHDNRPDASYIQLKPKFELAVKKIKFFSKELLTPDFVEKAHNEKVPLQVHAWTINEIKEMKRVLEVLEVDGVITDYPEVLLGLLGRTKSV